MAERTPESPGSGAPAAGATEVWRGRLPAARAAPPAPTAAGSDDVLASAEEDLQSLLARTLERIVAGGAAAAGLALLGGQDGRERPVARCQRGDPPELPPEPLVRWLARVGEAVDLGRPGAAPAERAAAARGWSCGVAVLRGDGDASGALLLAGPEDPPGGVRPRTLAALGAAARRLEGPVRARAAAERLTRLDAEVRRLDRLAALGDLLAEVAHEVRNPLVSVKTFLQLLPDRAGDPDFRTRFLAVVADEVRRIERLLDIVIDHARPAAAAAPGSATPPGPALHAIAGLLAHRALERGIRLEVEAAEDVAPVLLPEDGLRQVVLNLALNALDATPPGGRVVLRARPAPGAGDATELAVDDDGPGLPSEVRERVFEPFFSTKPERPGGLGLAICRRIVEECGGTLRVAESPSGGASFRASLPSARS